ncbi:hypothetical protein T05_9898 [Trichinella murrelli]|uniref:Uncharacterized protein n=1 Tax=Trichinella murrelli TaxID=144512 RepID=A0A0V0TX13_9BILA|nr:hypothetical protein T05_9898 [Trichinella murrelli]
MDKMSEDKFQMLAFRAVRISENFLWAGNTIPMAV